MGYSEVFYFFIKAKENVSIEKKGISELIRKPNKSRDYLRRKSSIIGFREIWKYKNKSFKYNLYIYPFFIPYINMAIILNNLN